MPFNLIPLLMLLLIACLFIILLFLGTMIHYSILGVGIFGPVQRVKAKVESKSFLQFSKDESKISDFLIVTDKGPFEMEVSRIYNMPNARHVFYRLRMGETYTFCTVGRTVQSMFGIEYPRITSIIPEDEQERIEWETLKTSDK